MNDRGSYSIAHNGMINLLRICTVFLAGVSFWATAQGMVNYVFQEKWQAYAASLAVQGLLLGLNFYLPVFLKLADGRWKKGTLIVLTGIILFCSSWFSYVFIAGKVYQESWGTESRLLVEQTYREELFGGNEYGEIYQNVLENELGQQILGLYERTSGYEGISGTNIGESFNWQEERDKYTNENFAAKIEMKAIIDKMEAAFASVNNTNLQEQAQSTIANYKKAMEERKNNLDEQVQEIEDEIDLLNQEGIYGSGGQNEENNDQVNQQKNDLNEQLKELEGQQKDYNAALDRVRMYESPLQEISNNSVSQVGERLRNIQNELFKENVDATTALEQATEVFEILLESQNLAVNEGTAYNSLLNEVNTFIKNLNRYKMVKEINTKFENCIVELRDKPIPAENWKKEWEQRLINLKSLISALPNYDGDESRVLMQYDRVKASNNLDEMMRNYISDHNAAQQGIIYLKSPYRGLAIFSLMLAFFFDLAGFATGVLIQIQEEKAKKVPEDIGKTEKEVSANQNEGEQQSWTTLSMLNHYIYLTGDFTYIDGKYTYSAFRNGEKVEADSENPEILTSGLYIEDEGKYIPITPQTLSFSAMEEGARDGVYMESSLDYEDAMLTIAYEAEGEDKEYHFLANVDENVPVYRVNGTVFHISPAGELQKTKDVYTVVVALNEKGTMVGAIYLI